MSVEYIPSHVELTMSTVVGDDNLSTNPVFLGMILCQHVLIPLSIFDTWDHMRTLCPPSDHRLTYMYFLSDSAEIDKTVHICVLLVVVQVP